MVRFSVAIQYLVPQHLLSRMMGFFANLQVKWFKNAFIRWYIKHYCIDMSIAERPFPQDYESFNDFFTRRLKPESRSISRLPHAIVSPVDGKISQIGDVRENQIIQAKGIDYSLSDLLLDESLVPLFVNGKFATLYLSPRDYHRVHMPVSGQLKQMQYIPGSLFSVNEATAGVIPRLYSRNERLICLFESEEGPFVVVMVGAVIVAAIRTVWAGKIVPSKGKGPFQKNHDSEKIFFEKGEEMGLFELGSTVILLFPANRIKWDGKLVPQSVVKMGEPIGGKISYLS